MDYFEYLNNLELLKQQGLKTPDVDVLTEAKPEKYGLEVFYDEYVIPENDEKYSVFGLGSRDAVSSLDYTKLVSLPKPDESLRTDESEEISDSQNVEEPIDMSVSEESLLNKALRNLFSFDEIRRDADTNADGELTADEAREYVLGILGKDGNDDNLSIEDLNLLIQEKGIDLESILRENSAVATDDVPRTIEDNVEEDTQLEVVQPEESNSNVSDEEHVESAAPLEVEDTSAIQNVQSQPTYSISAQVGDSSINYSNNSYLSTNYEPVEKTINNMSLDELREEKTKRDGVLAETQAAVNAVHNGTNEKIANVKTVAENARVEMQNAIDADNNVSLINRLLFQILIDKIELNDADIEENNLKLNDNKVAYELITTKIEGLTESVSTLTDSISETDSAISDLTSQISAIGDTDDTNLIAKKNKLQKRLDKKKEKRNELNEQLIADRAELEASQSEKERLENEKNDLDSIKTNLDSLKEYYDEQFAQLQEKIKDECSPETKSKIEAYENARKNIEVVRRRELETAQDAQDEALDAVKEVDAKISEVQNKKNRVSNIDLNIEDIPLAVRNRCSGAKIQTMPNGVDVLTLGYTRLDQMQPEMLDKIAELQQIAEEEGLTFVVSDGSRTVAESNSSRARKGNIVAKGGSSPHNYGVAIDIALYKDGKDVSLDVIKSFAQRAKAETGIAWGGDFRSNGSQETHHYELANWRRQYKTQDNLITRHESIT